LGCGCGLVTLSLARWGCREVTGADDSPVALALAAASCAEAKVSCEKVRWRRLDWRDLDACARLREELGPWDAVVSADCVLAAPPSGPMWRAAGAGACPPEPLLEATKVLARGGAE
ncbi:unnamed protein product, partial [Polarella glacialis]